jgi:hypothetical protein
MTADTTKYEFPMAIVKDDKAGKEGMASAAEYSVVVMVYAFCLFRVKTLKKEI